jgi:BirA family biotin operon repressor/biotin-[acetyl-CoA-carboxylase] ligase
LIEYIAETGSTNADLAVRLDEGVGVQEGMWPEGAWLVVDRQTAGRGRQGRKWSDGLGNFMGSTLIHLGPQDPPAHTLAMVASLALYETVQSFLPASLKEPDASQAKPLMLKWPNDLLLNNAKLSGILMERKGDAIILGIGVNLAHAPDLAERATIALSDVGEAPERNAFAQRLQGALAQELERWRSHGLALITRRWLAAAHPVGTQLSVHDGEGEPLIGAFDGVEEAGSLRLRLADGSSRVIHAGDVMLAG